MKRCSGVVNVIDSLLPCLSRRESRISIGRSALQSISRKEILSFQLPHADVSLEVSVVISG